MSFLTSLFDTFFGCCIPSSNLSINGRAYRIVKLLGEGYVTLRVRKRKSLVIDGFFNSGFSFVYLAQDGSGNLYALKKIRCTLGTEEAELAQREVDIYQLFSHKNIIKMVVSGLYMEF